MMTTTMRTKGGPTSAGAWVRLVYRAVVNESSKGALKSDGTFDICDSLAVLARRFHSRLARTAEGLACQHIIVDQA